MKPDVRIVEAPSSLDRRIAGLRGELLGFLRRRTPDFEETSQETWMRVAEADPPCSDDRSFRAFVYVVARRLLIDAARRRARSATLVSIEGGLELAGGSRPDGPLIAGQALSVVERTLGEMKADVAEVFRLRMTTDWSFQRIAEHQQVPLNTALGRHHQATKQIARALREQGLLTE